MPILAHETTQFPADLLETADLRQNDRQWWAVHTKPRQEKSLARDLLRLELPYYLPLVKKPHLVRGKTINSHLPLFDGYVFLFVDDEERVRALTTQRVAQLVPVPDQARLNADLRNLSGLIASNAPLTIERRLMPGRRVRIRAGVMRGLEGIVVMRRAQTRLLVAIDFLQQGASVAIDDYLLEPLD
jgi:transcriptional antiterminator RfaH